MDLRLSSLGYGCGETRERSMGMGQRGDVVRGKSLGQVNRDKQTQLQVGMGQNADKSRWTNEYKQE